MKILRIIFSTLMLLGLASGAIAQGTLVPFGDLQQDTSLPVEVTADQLKIDQDGGFANFTGNVVVGQGVMRLSADNIRVEYSSEDDEGPRRISRMIATGNVILINGDAVAEAQKAVYTIDSGTIVMTKDVIVTQGSNAMSSERMVVELETGTAVLEGRVRTILQTGGN